VGKTSLALSIAHSAAKRFRQRVAFFSLEMSNEQVVQRLISAETGINSQRLRRGEIAEEEWGRFMKAASDLAETHFFIDDTPGASALELRTKARRLHADVGLDLIVVDYLQLMRGDFRSENRVQEISSISRALKALARELNVPLLALSQLSRGVEARSDKRPILSDLRECLTGDAWVVRADIGERATMADLAAEGKPVPVWALDDDLKLKPVWMDRVFASGVKPVFRLRTRSGRTIRASGNHPFLRVDGWARLDRLAAGDAIAVPRTIPQAQQPIDCGRHDARYGEFPAATATTRHIKNPSLRGASVVCERRSNPRLRKGDCFGPNGGPRNDSFLIVAMPGWTPRTMKIRATLAPDHNPALSPGAAGCDPRVAGAVLGVAPFASDCRRSKAVLGCEEEIASAQTTGLAMTEGKILACSDVYWDQIESIEPDGEEAVYDGTVPGLHNFVANDMIVHNSGALEQDADVVIFIYRDELYNENTERKNIADILVAKHRNGPTGSVALYFKKELAQFLEAEVRRQEINF
jgi:replicative DNA helicase